MATNLEAAEGDGPAGARLFGKESRMCAAVFPMCVGRSRSSIPALLTRATAHCIRDHRRIVVDIQARVSIKSLHVLVSVWGCFAFCSSFSPTHVSLRFPGIPRLEASTHFVFLLRAFGRQL